MHTVSLGLGSNLGDRQANILAALQRLRALGSVEAVSSYYESAAVDGAGGPAFLNAAALLRTTLAPELLDAALRRVETGVGRQGARHLGARAIDIDVLLVDDVIADYGRIAIPHPYLARRAYNLIPLAEIAPDRIEPRSGERIAALAARVDASGIVRRTRTLQFVSDRQDEAPEVRLSIDRVGVSNVKRQVRLAIAGRETVFNGEFTMVADLAPGRAGVHMSRFSELLEEATLEVLARPSGSGRIEDVVNAIAREIVDSQRATRADVRLRADFGLERWTPVSGKRGEETYALVAVAHADAEATRHAIGVEAEGMTACPCAQQMMHEYNRGELVESGFSLADAERALAALPAATHNQRGRGSVLLGTRDARGSEVRAEDLVEIVENSMSSETYDLLKRSDEFFVVNKAHRNPKFVEDVVRGILARTLEVYGDFDDETFVHATQINYESIHKHDAYAEAFGTFGELRRELATGLAAGRRTDLAAWLGTRASIVVA